jgi:hypothetical protein
LRIMKRSNQGINEVAALGVVTLLRRSSRENPRALARRGGSSARPNLSILDSTMSIYRLHDTTGDDLGLLEHPAPNLESGDVVVLADGREAVVTARMEAEPGPGPLVAMLEVEVTNDRVRP